MDPDIAFVPGVGDPALDLLRAIYQLRANTVLDSGASLTTIASFRDDLIGPFILKINFLLELPYKVTIQERQ